MVFKQQSILNQSKSIFCHRYSIDQNRYCAIDTYSIYQNRYCSIDTKNVKIDILPLISNMNIIEISPMKLDIGSEKCVKTFKESNELKKFKIGNSSTKI
ncbi:unnamed protein product [Nesidiocoris tenuis]|uniref:Uncharacterized protein n=1 Tax=Nesidiocoris tenuis TaxID=355587 RepID=A0A6H5GRE5_9HEMI|nr:unnamed protein product [Nesidiocoris tenuis]